MAETGSVLERASASKPNLDSGIYTLMPEILWFLLAVVVLSLFFRQIRALVESLAQRVQHGAAIKIGGLELGPIHVSPTGAPSGGLIESSKDVGGKWNSRREEVYEKNYRIFLAHRLFPSSRPSQTYDILIYLIHHKETLANVERVEYFFGRHWGGNVFTSRDKGKRFAIALSAYGSGFLCAATIYFTNGKCFDTWRYIDFEMGHLGSHHQGSEVAKEEKG